MQGALRFPFLDSEGGGGGGGFFVVSYLLRLSNKIRSKNVVLAVRGPLGFLGTPLYCRETLHQPKKPFPRKNVKTQEEYLNIG